jgi:hypothetical protein
MVVNSVLDLANSYTTSIKEKAKIKKATEPFSACRES